MPAQEASGCATSVAYGLGGSVILGFISFLIGFVGPVIFMPESNQGPLLGIFITGPAGAIIGFVAGALYAQLHRRKK